MEASIKAPAVTSLGVVVVFVVVEVEALFVVLSSDSMGFAVTVPSGVVVVVSPVWDLSSSSLPNSLSSTGFLIVDFLGSLLKRSSHTLFLIEEVVFALLS